MNDGGMLRMNWGGTVGVAASATDKGGMVVVMDGDGNPGPSLPPTVASD
jgi:thiamine pyrophosphate-dependent acetolactate synthase large subunit-like protein